uniref:Ribosome-binding factor A n=2 Tax=unclassified Candidatus Kentrum TaxID=2643149 RepID=A0A451AAP1_9GAMM|nr:MAG: ribosome-binding factor A [Candidatus Kentron sp. LPFa]VFK27608.1 MAG: ribosome-binding factor A [Candidatus Kentron sp. LPFa]VFK63101.1 MAG: ribosome-binding factor A [Candidatus Kentron sp. UNK]VFK70726.1 MAG: ribosome-binding factor A [Candidatus Kentron sp. UNK]
MPREFNRAERMSYHIQRELSALIARDISDPRLRNLTISDVKISRDLTEATVYFTEQDTLKKEETLAALRKASGFLRKNLASRIRARGVPRLRFVHDQSFDQATRLLALIDNAVAHDS